MRNILGQCLVVSLLVSLGVFMLTIITGNIMIISGSLDFGKVILFPMSLVLSACAFLLTILIVIYKELRREK